MDQIYIVEEYNHHLEESNSNISVPSIALGLSVASVGLMGAAALAAPAVKNWLTNDSDTEAAELEFKKYVAKHAMNKKQAIERGYSFPPGHPLIGQTYRLHPLANYDKSGKQHLYIAEDIFDDILFEERESELLTLLVNLGAVEVEITKYEENLLENKSKAETDINVAIPDKTEAGLGASASNNLSNENNKKDVRLYTLKGKPWSNGDKLDKSEYSWLKFEPTWNALITAREIGGCTSATLEMKESSKYVTSKEQTLRLKAKVLKAEGSLSELKSTLTETSYIINVKFSDPE